MGEYILDFFEEENKRYLALMEPSYISGGRAIAGRLGLDFESIWRVGELDKIMKVSRDLTFKSVSKTTTEQVRNAIARVMESEHTLSDLQNAVSNIDNDTFSPDRAYSIARTENLRANTDGLVMAGNNSNIVIGYRSIPLSTACPLCQVYNDGEPTGVTMYPDISTDKAAASMGVWARETPPYHPNCHCVLVEILREI